MAASLISSVTLKPAAPFAVERSSSARGLPSLARTSQLKVEASGGKKIKTDKPYGVNGGMSLQDGVDASGRKGKGKGVYQFVDKYGANVDGYSPIYSPEEWSPSGDVYVGGKTGLAIWAVTLGGLLAGGALLVYNTSALAQ
ncbi:photosystem II 10 kDa polypeptide, chloroplastic isoform X2 [Eucalyptus grandis]|uniref:photosystem II 10 kDa polypeptide, chloroplastic isoform X2 n=1 Tax=Eucalyptus grandis TaxID=71139 RepID=UPI00192E93F9|nr:photosystem II 10 kDa polypeptide, chloroplastic isoform X2 [Eucalyptus grandis]